VATKKELIEMLKDFDDDDIVIVMDEIGGWDNVSGVEGSGGQIAICFGGGSPFSDE
jgi:hypothetical protein